MISVARDRTQDTVPARHALCQLRYIPIYHYVYVLSTLTPYLFEYYKPLLQA